MHYVCTFHDTRAHYFYCFISTHFFVVCIVNISNHKALASYENVIILCFLQVTLNTTTSVFLKFVSTILKSVAIQLEYMSDKEAGVAAEEILYYVKCLLPISSDNCVFCVTQVLKCLSTTNLVAYNNDIMSFFLLNDPNNDPQSKTEPVKTELGFYNDILMINYNDKCGNFEIYNDKFVDDRRASVDSKSLIVSSVRINANTERYLSNERQCFKDVVKISHSKVERRWNTNKQNLGRYLRLIEPVVIQALKVSKLIKK